VQLKERRAVIETLRLSLVQMRCEKGAIDANLEAMSGYVAEAARRGVDIIGFPEMSITGYVDPGRQPEAVLQLDGPEVAQVVELTRGGPMTLLAGLVEANPVGKPYITQIAARDGDLLGFYRKATIEDEELAWFAPGDDVPVFAHQGLTFGMAICADIGNPQVFAACARQGASLVFELAAPGLYGEQETRDWPAGFQWWRGMCEKHLSVYTREHGMWIAVATQAGRTVDEDFPGGGYVYAPDGRCLYATDDWQPGAAYVEIEFAALRLRVLP
jgi:predicted amidohydrolase